MFKNNLCSKKVPTKTAFYKKFLYWEKVFEIRTFTLHAQFFKEGFNLQFELNFE
jgi:hypothetical protein